MAGEFVSMIGTWMQMFAQGWLITTTLHASGLVLAGLNFTAGMPMLLLTLVGGRSADRHDKRLILFATLAVQFCTAAALGRLIALHQIQIWHIYLAAGIVGVAAAFEMPSVAAFVPELVPREEMSSAIALDRAGFHASRLVGPSLGGYLVNRLGAAPAYFANAFSFLALALALLTIRLPKRSAERVEAGQQGGIAAGLAYVKTDAPTRAMVLLMAAMTTFVSPFIMIHMPIYASRTLGLPADRMGYLMGFSGIGSLVGTLGLLAVRRGHRTLAVKLACALVAVALGGMALAQTFGSAVGSLILLTIGASVTFGTANIVIQERAPDALRGRVSSVAALSFVGIVPFSGVLIGVLIDHLGMRATLGCGAAGFFIASALLLAGRAQLSSAPSGDAPGWSPAVE